MLNFTLTETIPIQQLLSRLVVFAQKNTSGWKYMCMALQAEAGVRQEQKVQSRDLATYT